MLEHKSTETPHRASENIPVRSPLALKPEKGAEWGVAPLATVSAKALSTYSTYSSIGGRCVGGPSEECLYFLRVFLSGTVPTDRIEAVETPLLGQATPPTRHSGFRVTYGSRTPTRRKSTGFRNCGSIFHT